MQHNPARGRALKLAVSTSILSKGSTVLLQLIAIPIVVRVLGMEQFGIYASITGLMAFLSFTDFGIGPGLTKAIANAAAKEDKDAESTWFSSAFFLLLGIGTLALGACIALVIFIPAGVLFGSQYAPYQGVISKGLFAVVAIASFRLLFGVVERAQAGYQETHINNLWGTFANFMGAALLIGGIYFVPSILFVIAAVYGSMILAQFLNATQLIASRRPYLLPNPAKVRWVACRSLLQDGIAFSSVQLSVLAQREGGRLILAHFRGPEEVGSFSLLLQLSTYLGGMVIMVTGPLWPALTDAVAKHDESWIETTRKRLLKYAVAYAGGWSLLLAIAGPQLMRLWVGTSGRFDALTMICFGVYFFLIVWNHVHYIMLLGFGALRTPALTGPAEAVTILIICPFLASPFGLVGLLAGLIVAMGGISAWLYPLGLRRKLGEMRALRPIPK